MCRVTISIFEVIPGYVDTERNGCVVISRTDGQIMVKGTYQTLVPKPGVRFIYGMISAANFSPVPVGHHNQYLVYSGVLWSMRAGNVNYKLDTINYEENNGTTFIASTGNTLNGFRVLGLVETV